MPLPSLTQARPSIILLQIKLLLITVASHPPTGGRLAACGKYRNRILMPANCLSQLRIQAFDRLENGLAEGILPLWEFLIYV